MRPFRSIRWRLVALFLALALGVTAVFFFGVQRAVRGAWDGYGRAMLVDYADRLAAEIGSPPDPARAAAIVARLPLAIRIDGPAVNWDSDPDATRARPDDDHEPFGIVRRTADGHRILIGLAPPQDRIARGGPWLGMAAVLGLTALAWALVRRWLAPLDAIGAGAERFGGGDFAHPIPVRRDDELGDLAGRINRMAERLHGMLQAQRTLLLAISHELRSPLTRARLHAELLPEGAQREALVRELGLMRDLVADLLEGERLAGGAAALHAEPLELGALAREVAAGRAVALELAEGLGPVRADAARLRLLLRNLLDNAERHGAGAQPPRLFLRRAETGELALGVRDFGPGVPPEVLPHLAEAFYRPDDARTRAAGGVGLGLHLCRRVAEAHGGRLGVHNAAPGLEVAMVWRPQAA